MHKTMFNIGLGILLLVASAFSQAETIIRAGLWEITTRSDLLGLVQHVPSEQMQQISQLAKQYGVKIPHIQDGAVTSHICITPEMAQQGIPPGFYEDQSGCSVVNAQRSGNRYQVDLNCDSPRFKGSGQVEGIFPTPESFTGRTVFNSTVQGAPVNVSADTIGRWISERCEIIR